jgi:hypothetical protein
MSWALALAAVKQHAVDAGAAMTPPITSVRMGWEQFNLRQIRIDYGGDEGPNADTFTSRNPTERLDLTAFIPIASDDQNAAEATEVYMQALKEALVSRLGADTVLGGNAVDIIVGAAQTSFGTWAQESGVSQRYRKLTIPLTIWLAHVST